MREMGIKKTYGAGVNLERQKMFRNILSSIVLTAAMALILSGCGRAVVNPVFSKPAVANGEIVIKVSSADGSDPYQVGKSAAELLKGQMGDAPCHAVIIAEYFEDESAKSKALKGVCSIFDSSIVYGFASYGSFGQGGCSDTDTIRIIGIGGDGVSVAAALQEDIGVVGLTMEDDQELLVKRLEMAGSGIAAKLAKAKDSKLMILIPDAHSPKNAYVVQGAQEVVGADFPITGGSANKNPGQTYVYYQGQMFTDSAIAFMLSGDFKVAMTGRKAKENSKVISSAGDGFSQALKNLKAKPIAALAFNCAGRKGKLDNLEDELNAIQNSFGKTTPIFGTYCAGEIGPADVVNKKEGILSSGMGWHLMVTILGR